MHLAIESTKSRITSIAMHAGEKQAEVLKPLKKYLDRGLHVQLTGSWLLFRWCTRMGFTYYQIELKSAEAIDIVVERLVLNGIRVKPVSQVIERRLCSTKPTVMPLETGLSQMSPTLRSRTLSQQFGASQSFGASQQFGASQFGPTQLNNRLAKSGQSKLLGSATLKPGSKVSHQSEVVLDENADLRLKDLDTTHPVHLSVDTYAVTETPLKESGKLRWKVMGLASGLALSLVPKDGCVVLSRGCEILEKLKASPELLRVFKTRDMLVLCGTLGRVNRILQLQMPAANIDLADQWLASKGVYSEDPSAARTG